MSQPDFLYELFEDFMDDPANQDFSMDNGLVCRWLTGQAKISPKISAYYSKPSNQKKLAETIHQNLLPLMSDCNMAMQDIYTLFIQDDTISDAKKKNLASLYKPASSRLLFLAKLISFGMERQFIKRDTKNQKLLAGGALSPIVLDYIMDSEVPKPCRHFIMCNLCFLPYTGISARIFAKWLELPTLNEINDLIETGFVQTTTRHTISLHPMIKEIALSETKPSVSSCHILLDSLQKICLMHGIEVDYYKKLFQTAGNIIELIEKDDIPKYLLFLENVFPYMDNYNYQKGMKEIIQELKNFLKPKDIGTDSDRALLLDFQATLEIKPEKAIKLEKDALAQIENITADNARLVSNLHANLGGLYRMNGHPDLAREHMEKSISLLDQFNLLHINDSIPQIANYAMFLTEQQKPERGISELQKLSGIIKEYHSDDCLDYAKVQETLGTIYLMTANLPQAKTHFKRAFKIYEKIWADEPEMIEAKYQEIQELYPQIGFCIGKNLSGLLTK